MPTLTAKKTFTRSPAATKRPVPKRIPAVRKDAKSGLVLLTRTPGPGHSAQEYAEMAHNCL